MVQGNNSQLIQMSKAIVFCRLKLLDHHTFHFSSFINHTCNDQGLNPSRRVPGATLGSSFTRGPLSTSSIIWYQPMGGDVRHWEASLPMALCSG